jgi:hypothetical protein
MMMMMMMMMIVTAELAVTGLMLSPTLVGREPARRTGPREE